MEKKAWGKIEIQEGLRSASEMDSFCLELVERGRTGIFRGQHLGGGGISSDSAWRLAAMSEGSFLPFASPELLPFVTPLWYRSSRRFEFARLHERGVGLRGGELLHQVARL